VTDDQPLKPIAAPDHLASRNKHTGDFYSKTVYFLSIILAVIAILASAIGFAGFAENDQAIGHLVSAFLLCFGIGALAFGPLGIIAYFARRAIWKPMPSIRAVITLVFLLPWLPLGYYLIRLEGAMRIFGIIAVLATIFIGIWAIRYLRRPV